MRRLTMILATVIALTSLSGYGYAASEKSKVWRKHKYGHAYVKRKGREETHDDVRANYLDPAGDYKAYPSWARAALAPKGRDGIKM